MRYIGSILSDAASVLGAGRASYRVGDVAKAGGNTLRLELKR